MGFSIGGIAQYDTSTLEIAISTPINFTNAADVINTYSFPAGTLKAGDMVEVLAFGQGGTFAISSATNMQMLVSLYDGSEHYAKCLQGGVTTGTASSVTMFSSTVIEDGHQTAVMLMSGQDGYGFGMGLAFTDTMAINMAAVTSIKVKCTSNSAVANCSITQYVIRRVRLI